MNTGPVLPSVFTINTGQGGGGGGGIIRKGGKISHKVQLV